MREAVTEAEAEGGATEGRDGDGGAEAEGGAVEADDVAIEGGATEGRDGDGGAEAEGGAVEADDVSTEGGATEGRGGDGGAEAEAERGAVEAGDVAIEGGAMEADDVAIEGGATEGRDGDGGAEAEGGAVEADDVAIEGGDGDVGTETGGGGMETGGGDVGRKQVHRMLPDSSTPDSSEKICISALALLKMLTHARAPMEVMGLLLGDFVDEYTVDVVDVFAMPQSGTGVSVEAVDHDYQSNMLAMLKEIGRFEMVVGWYHSHPGFGCWLSEVGRNTQQSFEEVNQRAVGVVIDPIQSDKGKVAIDAFRLIKPQTMKLDQEPRQTTSNVGNLNKPSIQALKHGLNREYYSIVVDCRKNEFEEKMLLNVNKRKWTDGFTLQCFDAHSETNEQKIQEMSTLVIKYNQAVQEENELPPEQDAKQHLEELASNLISSNIV